MMLAFLVAFWAAPHTTAGHLLFAAAMTACILVGAYFEERRLAAEHGRTYRDYQARVPKLLPLGTPADSGGAVDPGGDAARVTQ